jgi:N-acetylglutamate synthase-like GNAT family acetyltransferase
MKCIHASEVNQALLQQFLDANQAIKQASLLEHGYVVEWQDKIIGCFELEKVEHRVYWLKQLYIIQSEAGKLPVLLEYILLFAKQQYAKLIYAHSEQPVTDLLLHSLQFSLQTEQLDLLRNKMKKGNWWSYKVS